MHKFGDKEGGNGVHIITMLLEQGVWGLIEQFKEH